MQQVQFRIEEEGYRKLQYLFGHYGIDQQVSTGEILDSTSSKIRALIEAIYESVAKDTPLTDVKQKEKEKVTKVKKLSIWKRNLDCVTQKRWVTLEDCQDCGKNKREVFDKCEEIFPEWRDRIEKKLTSEETPPEKSQEIEAKLTPTTEPSPQPQPTEETEQEPQEEAKEPQATPKTEQPSINTVVTQKKLLFGTTYCPKLKKDVPLTECQHCGDKKLCEEEKRKET